MSITLNWKTKGDTLPLFDVEISQEEGFFARAKLMIDALSDLPEIGTEGFLQWGEDEILFKGVLDNAPHKVAGYFAEIVLIAKPIDFLNQIEEIQKEVRVHPYWDPLYIRPEKLKEIEERQDTKMTSLYCDRKTGKISQSDWFEGRQTFDINGNFFEDSLHVKILGKPFKACSVHVHASWIQREGGVVNLSPAIRRVFPHFKVSTYTKNALKDKWPETGKRIGRSGVCVIKSKLKRVSPPSSLYPKFSPQIPLEDPDGFIKPHRVARHWFKPTLWVSWQAHQKRKETVTFILSLESYQGACDHKHIEFKLQNINPDPNVYAWQAETFYCKGDKVCHENGIYRCQTAHTSSMTFDQSKWTFRKSFHTALGHPARASFFLTDRGYLAVEHAIERARTELIKSTRNLEISFEATWEDLKSITTDSSVQLRDPRLPEGKIKGKVVKYALLAKGETGELFGRVTLLCSPSQGLIQPNLRAPNPSYTSDPYCEENFQVHDNHVVQTPTGFHYYRYGDQIPPQDREGPLLSRLDLINGPLDQEALMRTQKTLSSLKKAMAGKPTHLRLHFNDLRTKDCVEHVIQCDVVGI